MDLRNAHWLISGRVQGVGFRWFIRQAARDLGVSGVVRNLPDGRVEVRGAGPAAALERLFAVLSAGPRGARVDHVEELEADGDAAFEGFEVGG